MPHEFDKILISHDQTDFNERLVQLRMAICQASTFNPRSDEGLKVAEIIDELLKHGDQAVTKYTKEFDGVDLTFEQFRVSEEGLEKAHKHLHLNSV